MLRTGAFFGRFRASDISEPNKLIVSILNSKPLCIVLILFYLKFGSSTSQTSSAPGGSSVATLPIILIVQILQIQTGVFKFIKKTGSGNCGIARSPTVQLQPMKDHFLSPTNEGPLSSSIISQHAIRPEILLAHLWGRVREIYSVYSVVFCIQVHWGGSFPVNLTYSFTQQRTQQVWDGFIFLIHLTGGT